MKALLLLLYPKRLRNDRSINLNISDHVQVFLRENITITRKYDDRRLQSKERINV